MKYICDLKDLNDTKCVQIGQQHFYLIRGEKPVRMFSLICPHNGGIVEPQGELLVCPIHKWKFDARTGRSVVGSKGLKELLVTLDDGKIMADLEEDDATINDLPQDVDVTIKLLAHACLEIKHNGFTLLTDPWLAGPAFHGILDPVSRAILRPEGHSARRVADHARAYRSLSSEYVAAA